VPTIAYLFSGIPRTFIHPKVHLSILRNVVQSFGARPHFFFYFKTTKITYDDGYTTNTASNETRLWPSLRAEIERVLELFTPRTVVWAEDVDVRPLYNEKCDFYKGPVVHLWRFLSQWHSLKQVLDLMLAHERANSVKFDWAMKLRLDTLWHFGLKPYCGFRKNVAYNPHTFGESPVPFFDWWALINGSLAAEVFDTIGLYAACSKASLPFKEQGDVAYSTLKSAGRLAGVNKETRENFMPGYIVRDCNMQAEFCQYLRDPHYFANEGECERVTRAC
jgi:hypothetical protein